MTIVDAGWFATYELIDGSANLTSHTVELIATDYDSAEASAAAHATVLLAVTGSLMAGYDIRHKLTENSLSALPAVTVTNSNQAVISASIQDQPLKRATVSIPAAKIGVFAGATGTLANVVNVAATIVTDYLASFTAAGNVYVSDHEHLDPIYNAKGERVTKYRRLAK